MIVQLPIVCTDRMKPLQNKLLCQAKTLWFATFDDRPARLFDGLEHIRATIFLAVKSERKSNRFIHSTNYNRWLSEARLYLFQVISFEEISSCLVDGSIPKIGHSIAKEIFNRIASLASFRSEITSGKYCLYFHNAPQYWVRAMNFIPYFWNERDGEQISTQVKKISFSTNIDATVAVAALNSSIFYWWFLIFSDCRHLNMREIDSFPISSNKMTESIKTMLLGITNELMIDLKNHKKRKECQYKTTGSVIYDEFYPKHSKHIIDKIDCVLAKHYGFTDEELDFIINYDIKYRMGRDNSEE